VDDGGNRELTQRINPSPKGGEYESIPRLRTV
jgi:hypothetical protein